MSVNAKAIFLVNFLHVVQNISLQNKFQGITILLLKRLFCSIQINLRKHCALFTCFKVVAMMLVIYLF